MPKTRSLLRGRRASSASRSTSCSSRSLSPDRRSRACAERQAQVSSAPPEHSTQAVGRRGSAGGSNMTVLLPRQTLQETEKSLIYRAVDESSGRSFVVKIPRPTRQTESDVVRLRSEREMLALVA